MTPLGGAISGGFTGLVCCWQARACSLCTGPPMAPRRRQGPAAFSPRVPSGPSLPQTRVFRSVSPISEDHPKPRWRTTGRVAGRRCQTWGSNRRPRSVRNLRLYPGAAQRGSALPRLLTTEAGHQNHSTSLSLVWHGAGRISASEIPPARSCTAIRIRWASVARGMGTSETQFFRWDTSGTSVQRCTPPVSWEVMGGGGGRGGESLGCRDGLAPWPSEP